VQITATASVMTLPATELFTYLCVHGAAHGWCRLKWLADIHALLAGQTDAVIERYHNAAIAQGAQRAVGQALLLCADLFKLRLPDRLETALRASRVTTTLAKIGRFFMTRGDAATEIYEQRFGTTLIEASHLLLAQGLRAWLAEAVRKGIALHDVFDIPLPRRLALLYWVLRTPLWLVRRVSRGGASPASRGR
jgi:hypothetical protein